MHVSLACLDVVVEVVAELAESRHARLSLVAPVSLKERERDEAHVLTLLDRWDPGKLPWGCAGKLPMKGNEGRSALDC